MYKLCHLDILLEKKICGNLGIHDAKLKGFLICWLHTDLIDPVENQRTKLGQ